MCIRDSSSGSSGDDPINRIYTVTASGGYFYINGSQQPTLTLYRGHTFKFDQSDSTNSTHPFFVSQYSDGRNSGSVSKYTVGWSYVGTPGSSGAYGLWKVPHNVPSTTMYYACENHTNMGGTINIEIISSGSSGSSGSAGSSGSSASSLSLIHI